MSGAARLDIAEAHIRIVRDILRAHLPEGALVWVFGSRAPRRGQTGGRGATPISISRSMPDAA